MTNAKQKMKQKESNNEQQATTQNGNRKKKKFKNIGTVSQIDKNVFRKFNGQKPKKQKRSKK